MGILLTLCTLALAEPPPGTFLPGAQPAAAGELQLRVGGLALVASEDPWVLGGPTLRADWAVHERVQLSGWALAGPMMSSEWGPVGLRGTSGLALLTVPAAGVRVVAVQRPQVQVAPFVYLGGLGTFSQSGGARGGLLSLAGVAVEAGGERVRVDLSLSAFAWAFPIPGVAQGDGLWFRPWEAPVFSEAGLSWRVHPDHTLRLGLTSLVPTAAWRWRRGPLHTELRLASAGFIHLGSAQVGWSW